MRRLSNNELFIVSTNFSQTYLIVVTITVKLPIITYLF